MSRTLREINLSTRAARDRLKPSGKPYYRALDNGLHLGYRKGRRGAVWVARWYVGAEAYKVKSLDGRPDDVLEPDGITVLSWSQAQAEARKLFALRQRETGRAGSRRAQRAVHRPPRRHRLPRLAVAPPEDNGGYGLQGRSLHPVRARRR